MSNNVQRYCHVQQFIYYLHNKWAQERSHGFFFFFLLMLTHSTCTQRCRHARTHAFTHAHSKDNHNGPLHTWPVYKNCAPQHACIHWGQGYSLEEESTVGQHVTMYNIMKQNKVVCLGWAVWGIDATEYLFKMGWYIFNILQLIWCFFSSCLTRIKPVSTCCWFWQPAMVISLKKMKKINSVQGMWWLSGARYLMALWS